MKKRLHKVEPFFKKGDESGTPEDREFPVGAKNKKILK